MSTDSLNSGLSAATEAIRYLDRYTGRIETESVYGEAWLRWTYGSTAGRLALRVVSRPWFSAWYGWRMKRPGSRKRILPFLRRFQLDPAEFADPPSAFASFNDFFVRRLRPGVRPVNPDPAAVVFPADGRHLGFAQLGAEDQFFVKGQRFDLAAFLRNENWTRRYAGGTAVFSRLCPLDYHRFHFPVEAVPEAPRLLQGRLWSVNPIALRRNIGLLWQNRRWAGEMNAGPLGSVLMIEIGATNVGSAHYTFTPGRPVSKGDEKGYFEFGASAILTLFEPGRITLCEDLLNATAHRLELYAHVGDVLGRTSAATRAGPSETRSSCDPCL